MPPRVSLTAVIALLALSGVPVSRAQGAYFPDDCAGGMIHDRTPHTTSYHFTCTDDTLGQWMQQFQPPSFPWEFTKVCAKLVSSDTVARTEQVSVVLWSAVPSAGTGPPAGQWVPRSLLGTVSGSYNVEATNSIALSKYQGLNTSLVIWDRAAFIGVKFRSCTNHMYVPVTAVANEGSLYNDGLVWGTIANSPSCLSKNCGATTAITSIPVRVMGRPYQTKVDEAAPGWTCDPMFYQDGKTCNCNCGVEDPDCVTVSRKTMNCAPEEICLGAVCVVHGWNESLQGCDTALVSSDGMCQCGCGSLIDPDCITRQVLAPALFNESCTQQAVPFCSLGQCLDKWTCDPASYNDGGTCTCKSCGLVDPDCTAGLPSDCGADLTCRDSTCVPPKWSCNSSLYKDGKTCDCVCGAYDPDCDFPGLQVVGCGTTSQECGYTGTCVVPVCGNAHVDSSRNEDCDGDPESCDNCGCKNGYYPLIPRKLWCAPRCGDGIPTANEVCDGSPFCNQTTCTCTAGHTPSPNHVCSGCGNGIVEGNEKCDKGKGCFGNCTCGPLYEPAEPPAASCILHVVKISSSTGSSHAKSVPKTASSGKKDNSKVIIGAVLGLGGGLVLVAVVIVIVVAYRRRNSGVPQPIEQPMSMMGYGSQLCPAMLQTQVPGVVFAGPPGFNSGGDPQPTAGLGVTAGTGDGTAMWVQTQYSIDGFGNVFPIMTPAMLGVTGQMGFPAGTTGMTSTGAPTQQVDDRNPGTSSVVSVHGDFAVTGGAGNPMLGTTNASSNSQVMVLNNSAVMSNTHSSQQATPQSPQPQTQPPADPPSAPV